MKRMMQSLKMVRHLISSFRQSSWSPSYNHETYKWTRQGSRKSVCRRLNTSFPFWFFTPWIWTLLLFLPLDLVPGPEPDLLNGTGKRIIADVVEQRMFCRLCHISCKYEYISFICICPDRWDALQILLWKMQSHPAGELRNLIMNNHTWSHFYFARFLFPVMSWVFFFFFFTGLRQWSRYPQEDL